MIPYVGEYRQACDGQGRVNVPSRFRELLKIEKSNLLVAMKGLESCISLMPLSAWERFQASLNTSGIESDRQGRYFRRALLRGGEALQIDAQGRIQLNKTLREHARIQRDVVVYGIGQRFEIWSAETFDEYMKAGEFMGGSLEEHAAKYMWSHGPDETDSGR